MRTSLCILVAVLSGCVLKAYQQLPVQPASPMELRISLARRQVAAEPKSSAAYNNLAFALIRKGRDLRDAALYLEASHALDESIRLSPGNYDAQKLRVAVLLGLNQPAEALKLETELNHKVPDDIAGWALLVDANVALGNYDKAEQAAQWVLDLRPGSSLGFDKAAALRELFGDTEGAIEFLDEANRRTSQNDLDQKAWLLTRKAHLILWTGNTKAAADLLLEALRLSQDSQSAAAGLAQVRMAEGNYPDALTLLEKRYRQSPSAANLYDWAEALAAAGQTNEAAVQFTNFEEQARADAAAQRNCVLQLISYYSDQKPNPSEALGLANAEAAVRHDAPTMATYAWALYRSGKYLDAKLQMDKALSVGVRNPVYFCHAASISRAAKDGAAAERYSKELNSMPGNSCSTAAALRSANEVKP